MTTAGGKLATSVTVRDSQFRLATFAAGSTPPAWARALITNPKAWESAPQESAPAPEVPETPEVPEAPASTPEAPEVPEAPASTPDEDLIGAAETPESTPEDQTPETAEGGDAPKPSLPPKRGSGSGREPWAKYADAWGIKYASSATRDDIIELVEAAPDVPSDQ